MPCNAIPSRSICTMGLLAALAVPAMGQTLTFENTADQDITNAANWSAAPTFGAVTTNRWNINGTTVYSAAEGDTTLNSGRSLGIGVGSSAGGDFTITGGNLAVDGTSAAFMADAAGSSKVAALTVSGGTLSFTQSFLAAPRTNGGNSNDFDVTVTVDGGAMSTDNNLNFGLGINNERQTTAASTAVLDVSSGSLTVANNIQSGSFSSDQHTFTLNHTGGGLSFGAMTIRNGTLNMSSAFSGNSISNSGDAGGALNVNFDGAAWTVRDTGITGTSAFLSGTISNNNPVDDAPSTGTVTIGAGGLTIDTNDSSLSINADVGGSGALVKNGGGILQIGFGNLGLFGGGTDNTVTSYTGGTTINAGGLQVSNDDDVLGGDVSLAAGTTLGGDGTITGSVDLLGTFQAVDADDTLSVTGDLDITGADADFSNIDFFALDYSGGDVTVVLAEYGTLTGGAFGAVAGLPGTAGAIDYNFNALNQIAVTVADPNTPALTADLSGDGDVDDEDLGLFFSAFTGPDNGPSLDPRADLSGDGDVDDEDLGQAFSQFTGPLGPASVPEPTSLALLGLLAMSLSNRGGLALARRRRA